MAPTARGKAPHDQPARTHMLDAGISSLWRCAAPMSLTRIEGVAWPDATHFNISTNSRTITSSNEEDDRWLRNTPRFSMRRKWRSCWA